ncbi:MAG: hypothetical protein JWM21_3561 [Acidobacteria bacterium]|nr:hypothetical protein [Acidobacteriota bacterium]
MKKRPLLIPLLVVALFFSAWSNVIAASFCPRFTPNRACSLKHLTPQARPVKPESSCHHEMAEMQSDDMQMETEAGPPTETSAQTSPVEPAPESASEQAVLDLPLEMCAHCRSHSQPTTVAASLVAVDPSQRLLHTDSLPTEFADNLTTAFTDSIVPSEHSPPGPSSPRHILINVFRI